MTVRRLVLIVVLALVGITLRAQSSVEIDYAHPRKYTVGGVGVEGNQYFSENQILQLSGLREGMEITVPGDDVTGIVRRLVAQKYFEDVAVRIDSVKSDSAWVKVVIRERPRVSRWTYTGVKSGEKKDLQERLNLRPGREFSDYVRNTSTDIIKRYYKEKGFNNVKVDTEVTKDSVIRSAIRVNFIVDRGKKIHIKKINFTGNTDVKERKLAKNMKETHAATWYNFFKSKKFKEKTPAW